MDAHGDVAPTGRTLALRWAAVYVTEGDALKSEHLFFDQSENYSLPMDYAERAAFVMDLLGQLGLLPG